MLNQTAALDHVFQALADPTRRVMVARLARGPASVSAHSIHSADPVAFGPAVATRPEAEPGSPYVESIGPAAPRP